MAIGTAAAIGLGVAGIGSALGSRSASKAAGKAADTSLQVAQQNNALARDIYGQNKEALNPFVSRGNRAGDAINALLGLGGNEQGGAYGQQLPQQNALSQYGQTQPGGQVSYGGGYGPQANALRIGEDLGINAFQYGGGFGGQFNPVGDAGFGFGNQAQNAGIAPQQNIQTAQSAQEAQEGAFDVFRDSTGYQFRLNEGQDALNSNFAGRGVLRSGAAAKSALQYGQNQASNEFGKYMGYLSNQQGVGLSGASALAGVGQNYVNNVSSNNNSAGTAAANAALVKGQNNPLAGLLGTAGGFLSSYGG